MKILTRYIFKEMVAPTLLGFIFYTSIILMRELFRFAGMIIKHSLPGGIVGRLLLLSLPHIVVLTVPMSLLFGILIAIGRLSADSEIIAMRALGISTRTIYRPVFVFSFLVFLVNLYLMNYVLPKGNTELGSLRSEIVTSSAQQEIRPRLFRDDYENLMIYVNDVDPHTGLWKGVFVADSRPDETKDAVTPQQMVDAEAAQAHQPPTAAFGNGGHKIIVAESGNLAIVNKTKQIWMNLRNAQTHVWDPRKPERYDLNTNATQRLLLPDKFSSDEGRVTRGFREMDLRELFQQVRILSRTSDRASLRIAKIEIHKKFAIPFACIVFGVLGLPLGITNRRGGKSSGFSLSILIILVYWIMINNGESMAENGKIGPAVGMWGPNVILLAIGIFLVTRANRITGAQQSEGLFVRLRNAVSGVRHRRKAAALAEAQASSQTTVSNVEEDRTLLGRLDITFPNILDRYVLREFLKILGLVLVSVIALFVIVDYTQISSDIRSNHVPFDMVIDYYRFLTSQIIYWTLPISVLVATLVTFGMLSRNNEVTAFKSGGVSLYRVSLPVVCVAVVISLVAYLNLDFVLPYANQRSETLKRQIKGQKVITSSAAQKLWYLGKGRYLINFLSYDRNSQTLSQVQVFEFHETQFRLTRRVYANTAHWNGQGWVFENGWIRSFTEGGGSTYSPITHPLQLYYKETPGDFATQEKAPEQMTFAELRRYINTIRRSGYAAEELSVQLYEKTSWPAICVVMSLIALPFAFRIGKRGALYGVGIALILGIIYWIIFGIFAKFGEVGNLPPMLAAWSANILFAIAAVYLFLNVET